MTTAFNPVTSSPTSVATINAGDSITAATFQGMLNLVNSIAAHTHVWIDDYTQLGTSTGGGGGGGAPGYASGSLVGTGTARSPGSATGQVGLVSDGRTFSYGQNTGIAYHTNWYTPTTTGIINTYWIRTTVTSGTLSGGDSSGTWIKYSTGADATASVNAVTSSHTQTVEKSASGRFDVATDSGGVNIVATWTWTVNANAESPD